LAQGVRLRRGHRALRLLLRIPHFGRSGRGRSGDPESGGGELCAHPDRGLLPRGSDLPPDLPSVMIEISGLKKRFGKLVVLDGVDLVVPEGESLVVLGRSGSGKSVLLKNIIGLIKPDAGSIQVDGQEVTELDYEGLAELRKRFGMLFQMAALFDSMTVQENVGLALREHTDKSEEEI